MIHHLYCSNLIFETVVVNLEGHCLLGRMPMELLHLLWDKSPNLSLGERAEMWSTVDLNPCFMKVRLS